MRRTRPVLTAVAALLALLLGAVPAYAAPSQPPADFTLGAPFTGGHAHNDYAHDHPLYDALSRGFTSVEADTWYAGAELYVGHDPVEAARGRTLNDLYLTPLAQLVRDQGGHAYPCWPGELQLLVDFKSFGPESYAALERQLQQHPDVFTHVTDGRLVPRAVRVVISGERPREVMQADADRWAFFDGRPDDLATPPGADFMPLVSQDWASEFTWRGEGSMPADERAHLDDLVRRTHAAGARLRLWGTPDTAGPARDRLWQTLYAAGVDHINTDDLAGLQSFLTARRAPFAGCPTASPTPSASPRPITTASPGPAATSTPPVREAVGGLAATGH